MDLPQHYLAEVSYQGKPVYIPMHPDLILEVQLDTRRVVMQLPEGLLEL
jgi:16S rRNA processing protein RimM